ncbi:hypothetical protein MRB53_027556 [Persea americana]|uniref:Uncharacterized protein n=1 Tax=Persea americana TaxID=3435 RepID=A0ACC2LLR4_PERAE|nr:hypothetical protein MRB53_027556 [Persea americana]
MEVAAPSSKGKGGNKASSSPAKSTSAGASMYLQDLPSRGCFSSTVLSTNPGHLRVYICEHDTLPPAEQFIKTNQTNILIRALTNNKQKSDGSLKDVKVKSTTDGPKGKRSAERTADGNSSKKANTTTGSGSLRHEGSTSRKSEEFQGLTVERLRALLKERGLSTRGKKDELIARLKDNHEMIARMRSDRESAEASRLASPSYKVTLHLKASLAFRLVYGVAFHGHRKDIPG